jgi:hypothetical protein
VRVDAVMTPRLPKPKLRKKTAKLPPVVAVADKLIN